MLDNKKNKEMEKRIESESKAIKPITLQDMVCKDCLFRYDDLLEFNLAFKCEKFPKGKPNKVCVGGKCYEYIKE